jgi:hypothetical protein
MVTHLLLHAENVIWRYPVRETRLYVTTVQGSLSSPLFNWSEFLHFEGKLHLKLDSFICPIKIPNTELRMRHIATFIKPKIT